MMSQYDDLLCAEPLCCNHTAQANRAVADNSHDIAGGNLRRDSSVMTCAHHIGQSEKRCHQRIISFDRQNEERSVCQWDAYCLCLRTRNLFIAEEATAGARRLQSRAAELARAV